MTSSTLPKVGFLLSEPESRPDLLAFVESMADAVEVQLLVPRRHRSAINEQVSDGVKLVQIEPLPRTSRNFILRLLFQHLGNKPAERRHYRSYLLRRLDKLASTTLRKKMRWLLIHAVSIGPNLISYDRYLGWLDVAPNVSADIKGLDCLFVFSNIADDQAVAAAVRTSVPVVHYIYSWDHAPKFRRFPNKGCLTAVWSEPIAEDIWNFHAIPRRKVVFLPATQYTALGDLLSDSFSSKREDSKQFLFAASFGYPSLAKQEVDLFEQISALVAVEFPGFRLLFRGYPHLENSEIYRPLELLDNVVIDRSTLGISRGLSPKGVASKVESVRDSIAVIHLGTTVGIEAALCGTPVVYVNITSQARTAQRSLKPHLEDAWKQYHLTRYFWREASKNVVSSFVELADALERARVDPAAMTEPYGDQLAALAGMAPSSVLTRSVVDLVRTTIDPSAEPAAAAGSRW